MVDVPSYTKVLTLGAMGTEQALVGPVTVQEKVDGSQFAFGIDEQGLIACRSHHQQIRLDEMNSMFAPAVEYVCSIEDTLRTIHVDGESYWFYCEFLGKPKQNTLAYDRTPKNNLMLFDAWTYNGWVSKHWQLSGWAKLLGIDVVPELYRGEGLTMDDLQALLTEQSYLGGQTVEGVVVKNYSQLIALGGRTYPLFCKLVRKEFQERNKQEWRENSGKSKLDTYIGSFTSTARWLKAVQRMDEEDRLQYAPQDISALILTVQTDIKDEETENIKEALYRLYIGDIMRAGIKGLPEWYKMLLVDRLAHGEWK